MQTATHKRQFFRGLLTGKDAPRRPPWSLAEPAFIEACERCGDCVRACPESILVESAGGYPEVDFSRGGCDFCADCLTACKGRALRGDARDPFSAWSQRARIGSNCLSLHGVVCRSCGEVCDERAIRFRLELGGVARPMLSLDTCNGCGACVRVCPVQAVELAQPDLEP